MEYVITWVFISLVSAPCPDYNRKDQFGRQATMYGGNVSCAVMHLRQDSVHYEKRFENNAEAKEFLKELKKAKAEQTPNLFGDTLGIDCVKLDSIALP